MADGWTLDAPPSAPQANGWKLSAPPPTPTPKPTKPAAGYMSQAAFRSRMDDVYGAGRWRETSGYRTAAQEDSLRAQGAGMNRPGTVDPHMQGGPDDPGAYDIVVPGMNARQAAQRLRDANFQAHQIYPEGAHGTQGEHLHIGMNPESADPAAGWTLNAAPAAPAKPAAGWTLHPAPAAPAKKGAPMPGGVGTTAAANPNMGVLGAAEKLGADVRGQMTPEGQRHPFKNTAQTVGDVNDLAVEATPGMGAIRKGIGEATNAAGRAYAGAGNWVLGKIDPKAAAKAPITPEQGTQDVNRAMWAMGGEAGAGEAEAARAGRTPPPKPNAGPVVDTAPPLKPVQAKSLRPPSWIDAREAERPPPAVEKPPTSLDAVRDTAAGAKKAVQSTFAASTMSDAAKDTAAIVRRSGGESNAIHAQTARKLLQYDKTIGRLPIAEQRQIVDYIEGVGGEASPEKGFEKSPLKGMNDRKSGFRDPHPGSLGRYADTLYRETDPRMAAAMTPGTHISDSMAVPHYLSNDPDLALGQGENRGVRLEYDAKGLNGIAHMEKPGARASLANGGGEFRANFSNQRMGHSALKAVRVPKKAVNDLNYALLNRSLRTLEEQGWRKTEVGSEIEWRKPGAAPKQSAIRPELKEAADAVADSFKSYKKRIEYVLDENERPNFLENYYSHMWQEKPSVVADKMNSFSRQGSGRSFKARSIPTMRDGIEAGLTPKTENPIEVAMTYSGNMQRYLHTLDVQSAMTKDGLASMHTPGQQPEGWVPLEGIRTKEGGLAIQNADGEITARRPEKQLYAPEDAARIYNRSISRGFESGDTGPWWEAARKTSNGMTAMKLGLSAYHAVAETLHAHASDLSRGIVAGLRGKPLSAAKSIGSALTPGLSATKTALKGAALRREVLENDGFENLSKPAKAYIESGGRVKMDSLYSATSRRTFYQALKNKTFGLELNRAMEGIYKGPMLDRAKNVASLAANALQSAMGPLFEDYIPNLKAGAFQQRYSDWLDQNPGASRAQQEKFGRELSDHMDNRFGEMVYDNLFWHKQMKQTAQLLALAPGWDIGLLRELAGGVLDVPKSAKMLTKGQGVTDKTAYLVSLLAMGAYANGVMTYLKTGTAPKGRDFLAYRTGGQAQSASGAEQWDERGQVPGQQKDVYAQMDALMQLGLTGDATAELQDLKNKGAPWLDALSTVIGNNNWQGDPVIAGYGVTPQDGDKNLFGSAITDAFMPITLGQFKAQPGSNISGVEKLAGAKRAPKYLSDPDDYYSDLADRNTKRYDTAQRHAADQ